MPLANADIHVTAIRRTIVRQGTDNVPGYELHFTIRGQGDYTCSLPIKGYSLDAAMDAIREVAEPIVQTLDTFPGK